MEGISLICHNTKVTDNKKEYLEKLLGAISKVVHVKENDFDAAADLTSCAPGLIAAIFENFCPINFLEFSSGEFYYRF